MVECDKCHALDGLKRVLYAATTFVKGEAKTLGQLAARNTSAMGHYEKEDKTRERREAAELGRKQAGRRPKAEKPWYRPTEKINLELAKLAPKTVIEKGKIVSSEPLSEQAVRYIETGKK